MKYFRIKVGYGESEFVSIDETELETAIYIFLKDSKGVFKNGVVRGKDIIAITEDWHKEMDWNVGYKLQDVDWAELKDRGITKKYKGVIAGIKDKVQYLVSSDQAELIGKNVNVKLLESKK